MRSSLRALLWVGVPLLAALGALLALTWGRFQAQASSDREHSLQALEEAHSRLLDRQAERLQLIARYFAGRADLQELLQEAASGPALESWLEAVRREQELDLVALLAPDGSTLAATGGGGGPGGGPGGGGVAASAESGWLESVRGGGGAAELRVEGGRLYSSVVNPVVQRFDLLAVVVVADSVGRSGLRAARGSEEGEIFELVSVAGGGWSVAASTFDGSAAALAAALPTLPRQGLGEEPLAVELSMRGRQYRGWARTLAEEDSAPVAVLVTVLPAAAPPWLDPFLRQVATWSVAGVLLAVLSAIGGAWLARRRLGAFERGVLRLRSGDREAIAGVGGELAPLAAAVSHWAQELEGREQLLAIVEQVSRSGSHDAAGHGAAEAPAGPGLALPGAWLALEDRGIAGESAGSAALSGDGIGVVTAAGGEIVGMLGSRLVARFEGSDGVYRAIVAAGEVERQHGGRRPLAGAVTILVGEASAAALQPGAATAVLADFWRESESLLREAAGGELLLSAAARAAVSGALGRAGMACRERLGRLEPLPVHQLDFDSARRLGRGLTASSEWRLVSDNSRRLAPGDWIGDRYQLLSALDSGLQTTDFRAWDRKLSLPVTVKAVKRSVWEVPMERERLRASLERCRRLKHPGVVRILDLVGDEHGLLVITEQVTGPSLRRVIDVHGALTLEPGLRLARALSDSLAAVHAAGLLHLDLSPRCVLFEASARPRLDGVGVAQPRLRDRGKVEDGGLLVGGADYLAPEQIDGPVPDARTDVYSLGVMLYEVFTGHRPFEADSPAAVLGQHLKMEPPSPRVVRPTLPESLEQLLLRCLAKDPEGRFRSASELAQALGEVHSG